MALHDIQYIDGIKVSKIAKNKDVKAAVNANKSEESSFTTLINAFVDGTLVETVGAAGKLTVNGKIINPISSTESNAQLATRQVQANEAKLARQSTTAGGALRAANRADRARLNNVAKAPTDLPGLRPLFNLGN